MDHKKHYKQKIRPFDSAVEWLLKGGNIGMIYGFCNLSEVPKTNNWTQNLKNQRNFVWKNTWQTGCVLATWWFIMKVGEVVISREHWANYSVAGVLTMIAWQKILEIPPNQVLRYVPISACFSGILGLIIISNT